MQIQRYEVVYANSEQAFVEQINKMIKEGWQPTGGVSVNFQARTEQVIYHQAMVEYKREEPMSSKGFFVGPK
jgi:hypothetical protein